MQAGPIAVPINADMPQTPKKRAVPFLLNHVGGNREDGRNDAPWKPPPLHGKPTTITKWISVKKGTAA